MRDLYYHRFQRTWSEPPQAMGGIAAVVAIAGIAISSIAVVESLHLMAWGLWLLVVLGAVGWKYYRTRRGGH